MMFHTTKQDLDYWVDIANETKRNLFAKDKEKYDISNTFTIN